jgi:hypothetical protein
MQNEVQPCIKQEVSVVNNPGTGQFLAWSGGNEACGH